MGREAGKGKPTQGTVLEFRQGPNRRPGEAPTPRVSGPPRCGRGRPPSHQGPVPWTQLPLNPFGALTGQRQPASPCDVAAPGDPLGGLLGCPWPSSTLLHAWRVGSCPPTLGLTWGGCIAHRGRPEMHAHPAVRSYREGNPSAGCHKTPRIQTLVCPQGEPGSRSCLPRVARLPTPMKPAGALASAVPPCGEGPGPFSPRKQSRTQALPWWSRRDRRPGGAPVSHWSARQ